MTKEEKERAEVLCKCFHKDKRHVRWRVGWHCIFCSCDRFQEADNLRILQAAEHYQGFKGFLRKLKDVCLLSLHYITKVLKEIPDPIIFIGSAIVIVSLVIIVIASICNYSTREECKVHDIDCYAGSTLIYSGSLVMYQTDSQSPSQIHIWTSNKEYGCSSFVWKKKQN